MKSLPPTADSAPGSFLLGLIQMRVVGGDPARNLARAADMAAQAAGRGAEVLLFPEALDAGWTHPSSAQMADIIPSGHAARLLADVATRHGVYVCAGITERDAGRIYNSAVLLGPSGDLLARHRKLNELRIGHPFYAQGDRLQVVPTPFGRLGLMICADAFAPGQVLSRALGYLGADVILSPCAWAVPPDHDNAQEPYGGLWKANYGPVAADFRIWIAGVSNVGDITDGPWAGRRCIGCSLVVDPNGQTALQGPYGVDAECVLLQTVHPCPRPARGDDWSHLWNAG